jgi:hypothetical protein
MRASDINVAIRQRDPLPIELLKFLLFWLGAVRRCRRWSQPDDLLDSVLLRDQENGHSPRLNVESIVMGSGRRIILEADDLG